MAIGTDLCPALAGTHRLPWRIPLPTGDCRKPETCGAEAEIFLNSYIDKLLEMVYTKR